VPLREELEIMQEADVGEHKARLALLAKTYLHHIEILDSDEPLSHYNCVMHAFGLIGWLEEPYSPAFGRFYAATSFVRFLREGGHLRLREGHPLAEDLVVYLRAGEVKHVGRLIALGRVTSKWGSGNLYEHDLWEVPASFGDEMAFFVSPPQGEIDEQFKAYYDANGHYLPP
jgi:hypothetical protein